MTNDATSYQDRNGVLDTDLDTLELARLIETLEHFRNGCRQAKRRAEIQGRIDHARQELVRRGES